MAALRPFRARGTRGEGGSERVGRWHRRMVGIDGAMRRMAARMPQDA